MYDGFSGRRGVWQHWWWYVQKGVASKNLWDYVDLQSYEWECISDPSACSQGLSMSFWLRFKRKY